MRHSNGTLNRTPAQPFLAMIVLILATGIGVIASSASAQPAHGTCLASPELPCSASEGQTYGETTLADASDSEGSLEAVLGHVESEPTDVTPVAQGLTGDSADFDLTFRDANDARFEHFSWSYSGEASLAYLTVASDAGGFAIYDISQETEGSVDTPRMLGGERVTHVSFWQRTLTECAPVRTTDTHGKGMLFNCQLSKINRHGKVLCVHVRKTITKRCRFRTGKHKSGKWLEGVVQGKKADYAMGGQAISRKGKRGGAWVVASKTTDDAEVPCRKPQRPDPATRDWRTLMRDTASTTADGSLVGSGYTEVATATTNVGGTPLENYATRIVYTTTAPPHPDNAQLVSQPAPGTSYPYGYTALGAAMNDQHGVERYSPAAGGRYIDDPYHRHFIILNAATVAAAKRPTTKPDGTIMPSKIAWRTVAPNANIAN